MTFLARASKSFSKTRAPLTCPYNIERAHREQNLIANWTSKALRLVCTARVFLLSRALRSPSNLGAKPKYAIVRARPETRAAVYPKYKLNDLRITAGSGTPWNVCSLGFSRFCGPIMANFCVNMMREYLYRVSHNPRIIGDDW